MWLDYHSWSDPTAPNTYYSDAYLFLKEIPSFPSSLLYLLGTEKDMVITSGNSQFQQIDKNSSQSWGCVQKGASELGLEGCIGGGWVELRHSKQKEQRVQRGRLPGGWWGCSAGLQSGWRVTGPEYKEGCHPAGDLDFIPRLGSTGTDRAGCDVPLCPLQR